MQVKTQKFDSEGGAYKSGSGIGAGKAWAADSTHYKEWRHSRNKPYIAVALQCGAIAFLLFAYSDLKLYPEWFHRVSSSAQGLFLAPLLLYLSSKLSRGSILEIEWLTMLGGLAAMTTVSALIVYAAHNGLTLPYEGLLVIMLFIFLLTGATPNIGLLCTLPVFLGYFAAMTLVGASLAQLGTQALFMFVTMTVGYIGATNREMANRRIYQVSMELISQATTDELTGLSNRRAVKEGIANAWNVALRNSEQVGMLFLDIDYFKRLNDSLGHAAGDAALLRVAQSLFRCVGRPMDLVGRVGGEEFVIVAFGVDQSGLMKISEDIHRGLAEEAIAHPDSDVSDYLTVSIGAVVARPATMGLDVNEGIQELWVQADMALYDAKLAGRNQTCFKRLTASNYSRAWSASGKSSQAAATMMSPEQKKDWDVQLLSKAG